MPPQSALQRRSFPGPFQPKRESGALRVVSMDGSRELLFIRPENQELPEQLQGVGVRELSQAAPGGQRRFELESGGRIWTLVARSLQIHERAQLYGNVIALPRFDLRKRILWSLLLRAARYRFGQALIRRVTGRG